MSGFREEDERAEGLGRVAPGTLSHLTTTAGRSGAAEGHWGL